MALEALERSTVETPGLEGVVLRYGYFYGPEVEMVPGGFDRNDVRRRRAAIVGKGTGIFSLVHVDDAAAATIAALDRGEGIYNVCDDDPAPQAEWLPAYAEAIGAKPPRRVPLWLAKLVAGRQAATLATRLEGASNEKAKRELGWQLRLPELATGLSGGAGLVALDPGDDRGPDPENRGQQHAAGQHEEHVAEVLAALMSEADHGCAAPGAFVGETAS